MASVQPIYQHAQSNLITRSCYKLSSYVHVWVNVVKATTTSPLAKDLDLQFGYKCDPTELGYQKAIVQGICIGFEDLRVLYTLFDASKKRRTDLYVPVAIGWSHELEYEFAVSQVLGGRKFEIKNRWRYIRMPYQAFQMLMHEIEIPYEDAVEKLVEVCDVIMYTLIIYVKVTRLNHLLQTTNSEKARELEQIVDNQGEDVCGRFSHLG